MEVTVRPYDWISGDQDGGYSVRIWGHMRDTPEAYAKEVLIRVEDYFPWCRIELPTVVEGKSVTWSEPALRAYTSWLRFVLNDHEPKKILYKPLEKIYGFKNRMKFPFLICHFETDEAMRHCINLLSKQAYNVKQLGLIRAKVWETSITTIHRLVCEIKLGYGQWFKAKGQKVPEMDRISHLEEEYIVSYKDITPLDEEISKTWSVSPLIAAIDIECYSHNHRAMPNRDYADDVVFQVSFILQRLGHAKTRKRYLLVVGPCDPIPGAEVIHYQDEIALIFGLSDMIRKTDPSILLGYNIFGFDFPYLDARLKLRLLDWRACSRMKDGQTYVSKKEWKSSAYGFMTIAPLEAEGRICIDMYPIIRRDYKLDRYTLDFVSKKFLDRGKHDVSAKQMFEIYAECCAATESQDQERLVKASQKMAKVGDYCLEDSCLCIDLVEKLNTWIMLTELASIVDVKILHIFTQGQQLRVQNEVYRECWEEFVIDERPGSAEGFKGGKVQDPLPGKYRNILIFDFASLYPSIIRAFNICYTTLVPPESNLPDEMCHVLDWSEVDDTKKSPTFGQTKHYHYRFIKKEYFHGILPRMCEKLVQARSATRKLINPKNDPLYNIVLNQRQNGLKVTANSIFGSLGVSEGRLPLPEGASSVTAMGRVLIGQAANYVREKYKGQIVYGDSVTGDTPILIQRNGQVEWICIRDLSEHPKFDHIKTELDVADMNILVWSDMGWTKIKRFICHRTQKQLYRVLTHTGCVDVTEDHSLLYPDGQEVQPKNVQVGTRLLHRDLPPLPTNGTLTPEEAWVWGFFYGDGSAGTYRGASGEKSGWALNNTNLDYLNYAIRMLGKCEPGYTFKIYDTLQSSGVYKLEPVTKGGDFRIKDLVGKYREYFYNSDKHKIVPPEVLCASKDAKYAFMHGYYCADGSKTEGTVRMDNKGKIGTSALYHLLNDLGYKVSINIRADKETIYRLNATTQRKPGDVIKKIVKLPPTDDYVYDLETENHHFAAGVGRMVVHNTDSIMVDLKLTDPHDCLHMGEQLSKEITAIFPKPLSLEFERALAIGFFIKKKKYAGVPMAIIKLSNGDIIGRVAFDPAYEEESMNLYKFTMVRDGKEQVEHVAIPKNSEICPVPLEVGQEIQIGWSEERKEPIYRVNDKEVSGKKVLAGTPLAAGGKPNPDDLMKKGVVLARRDNCIWLREIYMKALLSIMFDKPLEQTQSIIDEEIMNMMTRQVSFQNMMVTRAIGSSYKPTSTYPLKIFSDELRKQGHQVQAGDRIDYVFVRCEEPERNEKQGYKMRIPEHYWANVTQEPLDYLHYVDKIAKNAIDQIFYLGYKETIDKIEEECRVEKKQRGKIYTHLNNQYIGTWVKLIKKKEELIGFIKHYKPHFASQEPYFSGTWN